MDTLKRTFRLIAASAAIAILSGAALAQAPADIELFGFIEGTIEGEPQTWRFNAQTGEPISLMVEVLSGNLDPILTIRDKDGAVVLSNDDYQYPDSRDSLLEAITIPELGAYTATISAFGDTAGDYRLTLLPGYGQFEHEETFDSTDGWTTNESASIQAVDGQILLSLTSNESAGITYDTFAAPFDIFYAQADVTAVTGSDWAVGMAARIGEDGSYYLYLVNERGEYRLSLHTAEGDTILHDWTRHPAIRPEQRPFTVGILSTGEGYDLVFNGAVVERFSDTTLSEPGAVGLAIDNISAFGTLSAQFDNLRVTIPVQTGSETLIPQNLFVGIANVMAIELERRQLVPANGEIVLNLAESFSEYARPGVNILPLASQLRFTNLAIGTTVYSDGVADSPGGCGLILRAADETHYTLAYLDGHGGYGLSQRDGDTFTPGLYTEDETWDASAAHHLLVIADDTTLLYYVDGRYIGTLQNEPVEGGIGNAVVNFDPVYTSCSFVNTWVYRWD
jgi:pre-peptidase